MKEKLPVLDVQMFGKFIITYEGRAIPFGRNSTTKAIHLLAMLLYAGENGVRREDLQERLYGGTDSEKSQHSVHSGVFYLKRLLSGTALPEHDYVIQKKGVYYWNAPMETVIDARIFQELSEDVTVNEEQDVERLKRAIDMYRRNFLVDFSDQDWVLLESIRLKRRFMDASEAVFGWHMERKEFEEALALAERVCAVYPFDEWQANKMKCLIAMDRAEEAVNEYYETERLLRKELDVEPSEKMRDLLRIAKNGRSDWAEHSFADALNQLHESGDQTDIVYYCDLPGFRDTYRMIARRIEYNGKSASLMMLSIEMPGDLKKMMKLLKQAIWQSLRRTDVFTQCSTTQYLVLLYGVGEKDGRNIAKRIRARFQKTSQQADCLTISIAPVEPAAPSPEPQEYKRTDDNK